MQSFGKPTPQQCLRRIHETAAWCASQSENAALLRTTQLRPKVMNGSDDLFIGTRLERYNATESLAKARAQLIPTLQMPISGRLLAYDPESSLCDGAAPIATQGYFDVNNAPPWDTWLYFIEEKVRDTDKWSSFDAYLLSWVPAHVIDLVDAGIDVNPEKCLCWVRDLDTPFIHILKQWEFAV